MPIIFALLAAISNALATVLQRIGVETSGGGSAASNVNSESKKTSFKFKNLLKSPVWFAGLGLMTASFLLQAIALAIGNLTLVQPVMVTELLFIVIILGFWFDHPLGKQEIISVLGVIVGLGIFLGFSFGQKGSQHPDIDDWMAVIGGGLGIILISLWLTTRGGRSLKAACFGIAGGTAFAITAAFIKQVAEQWPHGILYILSNGQGYGVALAGTMGLILSQHALDAGPVAASQSALLISNPLASIIMGVYLFGNHLDKSGARLGFEIFGLGLMFVCLFTLSHSPLIASQNGNSDRLIQDNT
ncbi:MAG: DMT family transporter [Firmicutes bacterium]|nr:DMT family transporter [Bacillota bacterium]